MKNLITLNITRHNHVTSGNISNLEKRCNHKLTLFEKIFMINLGSTQQLLEILTNSAVSIEVIKHEEEKDLIRRDVKMLEKETKDMLLVATSYVYKNELPCRVLEELRSLNNGIGIILLKYNLGIYRRIRKIGYDRSASSVFRKYEMLCNRRTLAEIEETFLLKK